MSSRWATLIRVVAPAALCLLLSGATQPAPVLALLGDVMVGRGLAQRLESPQIVWGQLLPWLAGSDLALANLESPLSDAPARGGRRFILCAPPGRAAFLAGSGLDILNLENNHRLDCGAPGAAQTGAALDSAGLGALAAETQPLYRHLAGLRLAFVTADGSESPLDEAGLLAQVRTARASAALVIVSLHWGQEYQSVPGAGQRRLAQRLAQAGAALIWGHHPHVLQPVEWLPGASGCTPVVYSLGNALFDATGLEDTRRSALLVVRLGPGGVAALSAFPFRIDPRRGQVQMLSETEAAPVRQRLGMESATTYPACK